jgi:hypothetical protein
MKALILLLCLVSFTASAQNNHHLNHNDYQMWMTPPDAQGDSYGCCNHTDCDIVREKGINDRGEHIVRWRGKDYVVPKSAWLQDRKSPDEFNSHACVINGRVVCYVPGEGAI